MAQDERRGDDDHPHHTRRRRAPPVDAPVDVTPIGDGQHAVEQEGLQVGSQAEREHDEQHDVERLAAQAAQDDGEHGEHHERYGQRRRPQRFCGEHKTAAVAEDDLHRRHEEDGEGEERGHEHRHDDAAGQRYLASALLARRIPTLVRASLLVCLGEHLRVSRALNLALDLLVGVLVDAQELDQLVAHAPERDR